ncbi:MAG: FHA domain-containing protein [Myxococcota bacterium]
MIRLSIAEAGKPPQLLTFNASSITVGRAATNELCLTGTGVSSKHCRITRQGDAFYIEDMGSTNGTYVNRQKVQAPMPLGPQDEVVMAVYRLRILANNETGAPRPVTGAQAVVGPQSGVAATPGRRGHAPTAHVPAPNPGQPMPGQRNAPSGGYPSVPGSSPSMPGMPGHPGSSPSGAPVTGYPGSSPSGMVPQAPNPNMMGSGQSPVSQGPAPGMMGSGQNPVSQGPAPGMMGSGQNPAQAPSQAGAQGGQDLAGPSGRSPVDSDVGWEREWQQVEKMSQAWLGSGKNSSVLLTGAKLKHARQWLAQGRGKRPAPTSLHREFIVAGTRASRLRSFGLATVGLTLVAAVGVGGWWYSQQASTEGEGDDEGTTTLVDAGGGKGPTNRSGDQGDRGRSDEIAAQAEALLEVDPLVAAQLATEAVASLPRNEPALDAPAFRVFRKAMRKMPGRPLRGTRPIKAVALSPDGHWAITSEDDGRGTMRLWDLYKSGILSPGYLRGHSQTVSMMEVSRDGRWLITADSDGLIHRWNLQETDPSSTGTQLSAHRAAITALSLSGNGRWLASADDTGQVRVWDLEPTLPSSVLMTKGPEVKVTDVAINFDGTRVIASSEDGMARNWKLTDGRPGRAPIFVRHSEDEENPIAVTSVGVANDDSQALTGVSDGTVFMWVPTSRAPTRKWEPRTGHKKAVNHMEVSVDSSLAVSAAEDNNLIVWNLGSGASSVKMSGHTGEIHQLELFSMPADFPAGRRPPTTAFSASADGTARSWNLDNRNAGIESRTFTGHVGGVNSVAVSGDGQWVLTGGGGGVARLWDWQSVPAGEESDSELPEVGSASLVARGHAKAVVAVGIDNYGRRMLTGSADGTARVWDLRNPTRVHAMPLKDKHESRISVAAVSSDPRYGVTGDDSGRLVLWQISQDEPAGLVLEGHGGELTDVEFTPEGDRMVSVSTDNTARIWTIGKDIKESVAVLQHADEVTRLAISGDSKWLLTGALTKAVLWKLDSPDKPVRTFDKHESDITAVAMGPRGKWAASGSADHRAVLYDISKSRPTTTTLRNHSDTISVMAFQPTGKWLATGSDDKTIRLWDLQSEHPDEGSRVLPDHEGGITDLLWSPDGTWLLSASNDGAIRLWDMRKDIGEMIEGVILLDGHSTVVRQLALVPGDSDEGIRTVVSASYDGTARVWPLEPTPLVMMGCARVGQRLSEEEWAQYIGGDYDPSC